VTGDDLRRLRRMKLKLSQAKLAKRLGVTVTTVARWERDERVMSEIADRFVRLLIGPTTRTAKPMSRRRKAP
jgi:DNA-binding transcriptional regulator YiaG